MTEGVSAPEDRVLSFRAMATNGEHGKKWGAPLTAKPPTIGSQDVPPVGSAAWFDAVTELFGDEPEEQRRLESIIRLLPRDRAEAQARAAMRRRMAQFNSRRSVIELDLADLEKRRDAHDDILAWMQREPFCMEPIGASALHRVLEEGVLCDERHHEPPGLLTATGLGAATVFLVQHDWAALLKNADVDAGDVRLPFDLCCFEFQWARRRVCLIILCDDGQPHYVVPLLQTVRGWWLPSPCFVEGTKLVPEWGEKPLAPFAPLFEALLASVRAVAITLDAEVTESQIVQAPEKVNAKRLKRGGVPIYDHHVISIRHRYAGIGGSHGSSGARRRLHFRRGHWRHYPSYKRWIKWMLVGDPTLGFADKDYRLSSHP